MSKTPQHFGMPSPNPDTPATEQLPLPQPPATGLSRNKRASMAFVGAQLIFIISYAMADAKTDPDDEWSGLIRLVV